MLSAISLPIRIFLSMFLLASPHTNTQISPSIENQNINSNISIESTFTIETNGTFYEAILRDNKTKKELGRVVFSYNKFTKFGYIAQLHVAREERNHSYGSMLLKFALEKLTQLHCNSIYWQAYPFDLCTNQTPEAMLPKLIAFYKRHGAQVLSQTASSAQMVYYPHINPQAA